MASVGDNSGATYRGTDGEAGVQAIALDEHPESVKVIRMEDDDLVTSQLGAADYLEEPLRECRHGQKYTEHDSVAEQEDALVSKTSVH